MRRPIGLNALFLEPGRVGGTETYVRQLVPALAAAEPRREWILYLSREAGATEWDVPDNVRIDVAPCRSVARAERLGWELTGLVARAVRHGVGLLHSLGTTSPLVAPLPLVVTVHDLIFEVFPQAFPGRRSDVLRRVLPPMARRAERVIADSRATARDLESRYRVPPGRLRVVPLGPGRPPLALADGEARHLRARAGVREGAYVLSVATTQPHKNLGSLVAAMAPLRQAHPGVRLVLAGAAGTADEGLRATIAESGMADAVDLPGRVDDATLDALYAGARAFVYPSLYEGFGLPLLEAMERGVPTVSSRETSLPEVGGEAVLYADAREPRALAEAIGTLLTDEGERRRRAAAGRARATRFSWRATAEATLAAYGGLALPDRSR